MKKCVICNKKIKEGEEARELFNGKHVHEACYVEKTTLFAYDWYGDAILGLKSDMFELGHGLYTTSEANYNNTNILRDYHDRDIAIKYLSATGEKTDEHTRYIGFELETEWNYANRDDKEKVIHYIRKQWRDLGLVFEYDGSLSNGIEFISQPMTRAYYEEHKQDLTDLLNYIQAQGGTSHDGGTCGLHFHVSRQALGNTEEEQEGLIDKILLFIEFYKEQIKAFSRRTSWGYCRILSDDYNLPSDKYYKSEQVLGEIKKSGHTSGHGTALNTGNASTIEYRFIRGTLNPQTFFASFYFINNIIDIFNTYALNSKKITFDNTIKLGDHAELIEYAKEKSIFNDTPLHSETYNIKRELRAKEHTLLQYKKTDKAKIQEIYKQAQTLTSKYTKAFLKAPNEGDNARIYLDVAQVSGRVARLNDEYMTADKKDIDLLTLINTRGEGNTRTIKSIIDGVICTLECSKLEETEDGAQFKQLLEDYMTQLNERGQD